jgi:hypothetical protein
MIPNDIDYRIDADASCNVTHVLSLTGQVADHRFVGR